MTSLWHRGATVTTTCSLPVNGPWSSIDAGMRAVQAMSERPASRSQPALPSSRSAVLAVGPGQGCQVLPYLLCLRLAHMHLAPYPAHSGDVARGAVGGESFGCPVGMTVHSGC